MSSDWTRDHGSLLPGTTSMGRSEMPCDYHSCAQCLESTGDKFSIGVTLLDRHMIAVGYTVADGHKTPAQARELARQLLDAADKAEDLDWKAGIK
jgi:hypothetical protein